MGDDFFYHERVLHGSEAFPVSMALVTCKGIGDGRISIHDEWQLIFMNKGTATFSVDAVTYSLCAGDALMISSGTAHSAVPLSAQNSEYYLMLTDYRILYSDGLDIIRTHYIEPFTHGKLTLPVFLSTSSPWACEALKWIARAFMSLKNREIAYELLTKASLYRILHILIINAGSDNGIANFAEERLHGVLSFIKANIHRHITLDELARLAHMTPEYFCKFFKDTMNETPMEYINRCRVSKCCHLLAETKYDVSEIAQQAGFSSASYFVRVFKKHTLTTPTAYRKKAQEHRIQSHSFNSLPYTEW